MSSKHSAGDSASHSSSSRRDSHRHRSQRSPSLSPVRIKTEHTDQKILPEHFGRMILEKRSEDDGLNILQRMKTAYLNSPLASLYECVKGKIKIKIWTRNYKQVRGILTGYLIAFDKHWNLIIRDVDEVYLKPKKSKTPFLRDLKPDENLPDMPRKVPRQKRNQTQGEKPEPPPLPQKAPAKPGEEEKPKRKKKRSKATSERRQVDKLFIRGDTIVMICPLVDESEDEDDGDE